MQDTERHDHQEEAADPACFNPFDPMQDTERTAGRGNPAELLGFNPFDPMQDTESREYATAGGELD